jgi:hypothetical protein
MSDDRVARLESRLERVEQQIRSFIKLHSDELELMLDELTDIRRELGTLRANDPAPETAVDPADPAANSPKRAKWLAEQARASAPKSRRELLLGKKDEPA